MAQGQPLKSPPPILRVTRTRRQVRAFYDGLSRLYDAMAEHSEGPLRRRGLELLDARPGERVLEVGCGTGHALVALARAVGTAGRVIGLDLSEGMLHRSRVRFTRSSGIRGRVDLGCADACALPVDAGALDAVFLSFTLELFDTPEIPQVLGECMRVLEPGGRLCVVASSRDSNREWPTRFYEWAHLHFPALVDCRPIFARDAIERAGFHVWAREIRHMWIPVEVVLAVKPAE